MLVLNLFKEKLIGDDVRRMWNLIKIRFQPSEIYIDCS